MTARSREARRRPLSRVRMQPPESKPVAAEQTSPALGAHVRARRPAIPRRIQEVNRLRLADTGGRLHAAAAGAVAELLLTLKKWRLRCPKGDLDLVFPTAAGLPPAPRRAGGGARRRGCGRTELPTRFHVHPLRHSSFCSALLAQGAPSTEVQRYSGHAPLSTLLDVYSRASRPALPSGSPARCGGEHFLRWTPPWRPNQSGSSDTNGAKSSRKQRRGGDSNPRTLAGYTISSRAVSTGLTHLSAPGSARCIAGAGGPLKPRVRRRGGPGRSVAGSPAIPRPARRR